MAATSAQTAALPLTGLRVLDFSHAAAGPFATMFMADLGAEVIKVEKPGRGDGARYMGEPMLGPIESDYYLALNRNKKSVLLDLSTEDGRVLAKDLARTCDVVVQNFRPGVLDRHGLGYEDLRKVREGLVYCSISAFGSSGPWRNRPANDIIMQSVSGLMGITGEVGGGPVRIGAPISDYATGLFALAGILAALHSREAQPEGQHVEIAMLDASMAMMANYIPSVATLGKTIPRLGRGHAQIVPYQAFLCSDGQYVMVGAFTNGFWRRLCDAVGRPEWKDDPRFTSNADRLANRDVLMSTLEQIFLGRTREEWLAVLELADVPNSPVLELNDAIVSEQAMHNGIVQKIDGADLDVIKLPVESDRWRPGPATVPPVMGEHTDEVLGGLLGLAEERIDALVEAGVVARAGREARVEAAG
ncbi:CaiB/BaiF CoA transferase family protein [Actinophytocola oryzae]|uniref:Formyl-CoA transferase n=1 Tax=Actinophytocola oryzae TaxID=502181 RepID=A0A4V3FUS9_9PSEU|nr:CoA transferase [Actinophytocola oryzae]TDV56371.1 formyl-CoA transferase [Actinophytocola oryzae]